MIDLFNCLQLGTLAMTIHFLLINFERLNVKTASSCMHDWPRAQESPQDYNKALRRAQTT